MATEPGTAEEFDVGAFLQTTVPMVRTLNFKYLETTAECAVLRMRDQPEFHNHLGGPHAGAMFTLAESASGAIVFVVFGDQLSRAVPLPVHAEIDFKKVAKGTVTATAELAGRSPTSSPNWTPGSGRNSRCGYASSGKTVRSPAR